MAINDYVRKKMQEHFTELMMQGIDLRCPLCRHDRWTPLSMEAGEEFDSVLGDFSRGDRMRVVPRVVMACNRCSYLMDFAWRPISQK